MTTPAPKSTTWMILMSTIAMLIFGVVTWWVVDIAGGTKIEPSNSNTPNATIPGPPAFT